MHPSVMAFLARHVAQHSPFDRVVELGSLDINGSARMLFPIGQPYIGVDRQAGPGVDLVSDIETIKASAPVDLVVCTEVLEHAPDQGAIVAKAWELLRPGGHLILTAATDPRAPHSGIDENPIRVYEHYRNVVPAEMHGYLRRFTICEEDLTVVGDYYVCARRPE